MDKNIPPQNLKIYRVSQLARELKTVLEDHFGQVWIEGEISGLSRPASGHIYFDLKDGEAVINVAFFRGSQRASNVPLENGKQVKIFGDVTSFAKTSRYQIICRQIEEAGLGKLHEAFERLKRKLKDEGLFDPTRKKPLPLLPKRIGIVTSSTGAALQDMLNILDRRFSNLHILIAPVKVQGDAAANEIAKAIARLNRLPSLDVIIIGRGGGSMEDLWAFNEEVVARAISESRISIISAVGHETDFCISDFAADLRAPTPSAAAELVIGRKQDFEQAIAALETRLWRSISEKARDASQRTDHLDDQLQQSLLNPLRLAESSLQGILFRLQSRIRESTKARMTHLQRLQNQLDARSPQNKLRRAEERLNQLQRKLYSPVLDISKSSDRRLQFTQEKLLTLMRNQTLHYQNRLQRALDRLESMNPGAVLKRGYSVTRLKNGQVLTSAKNVRPGSQIVTQFSSGRLESSVSSVNPKGENKHEQRE